MAKKILLINSDLAKNRGDRAITEGIIQLIKERYPEAHVTGISEYAARDTQWFGISFLDMDTQSLSPVDFVRLLFAARKADVVFWGGGEILKDYTNKSALWYWSMKLWAVSLVNHTLYGVYQGIGPTSASSSKKLIARVVNRCQKFIVRDHESYEKLVSWGVSSEKLIAASDPAILPKGEKLRSATLEKLKTEQNIDTKFLDNFICVGPRSWFHYKTGGIIPFKYKRKFLAFFGKQLSTTSPEYTLYRNRLIETVDAIIATQKTNVLLVPMHMSESDPELCEYIMAHAKKPDAIKALTEDSFSPHELRSIMASAKAMIGFRLHSNIIATSSGVPSINIYYVDKGRVYFEQIKQQEYSIAIEKTLDEDFVTAFTEKLSSLISNSSFVTQSIQRNVTGLRKIVKKSFEEIQL